MDSKFSPVLTIKVVKLVRDRGVTMKQAGRGLDVHTNVLRKRLREAIFDPESVSLGYSVMKPEQPAIERLRRGLARTKAERDNLKEAAAHFDKDWI